MTASTSIEFGQRPKAFRVWVPEFRPAPEWCVAPA